MSGFGLFCIVLFFISKVSFWTQNICTYYKASKIQNIRNKMEKICMILPFVYNGRVKFVKSISTQKMSPKISNFLEDPTSTNFLLLCPVSPGIKTSLRSAVRTFVLGLGPKTEASVRDQKSSPRSGSKKLVLGASRNEWFWSFLHCSIFYFKSKFLDAKHMYVL